MSKYHKSNYCTGQLCELFSRLLDGQVLTPLSALRFAGTLRLSERIRELQRNGVVIHKKRVKTRSGKHVMSYWM